MKDINSIGWEKLNQPFEAILLLSLVALTFFTYRQPLLFISKTLWVISAFLIIYSLGAFLQNYIHWSLIISVYACVGIAIGFIKRLPDNWFRWLSTIWLVLLIVGLWYLQFAKYIPFHTMHYINQPFRLYFSGFVAWGIFTALTAVAFFLIKNKSKAFICWVGVLWLFTLSLEGYKSYTIGLNQKSKGLYWGAGVDKTDHYGETPLYNAVQSNNFEEARTLINEGADVNQPRKKVIGGATTPFQAAILSGNYELFELLAKNGGNLDLPNNVGDFPIHLAAYPKVKDIKILEYLLAHGADINLRNSQDKQPIHIAMELGYNREEKQHFSNIETINFLLNNGADIESPFRHHHPELTSTPLLLAVAKGNLEAVKLLVEKGANLNVQDPYGRSPLEFSQYMEDSLKQLDNKKYSRVTEYLKEINSP